MMKMKGCRRKSTWIVPLGLVAAITGLLTGCARGSAEEVTYRADVITIDGLKAFGELERPSVTFQHDRHTLALAQTNQDCETCHQRLDDGRLSQKYRRLVDEDRQTVMDIYHLECVTCHRDTAGAGLASGPTTCGDCHQRRPRFVTSRQPMGFDRSLHHRHVEELGQECGECHHEYNKSTKEIYYAKGEESTCRYCHLPERQAEVSSLSEAAHLACVNCHLDLSGAGPTDCYGCHDLERQSQIARVENPARLDRGQPDFVLLHSSKNDISKSTLPTVPFPHIEHEATRDTCRSCHHQSMATCVECHTLAGNEDTQGVTLQQAMHSMTSEHSCVGCHDREKAEPNCAGCHDLMEQGRLTEHACTVCHTGPLPAALTESNKSFTDMAQFRPEPENYRLSFTDEDVPETVTIDTLSEKYEPAVLPHRQIVDKLMEHIADSKIATHFHGDEDVVCQGCHHYSPVSQKPPRCESCHSAPFNESDPFKPGLFGAFHRQCIGCHESMQIEKPATTDCVGCHALKPTQAASAR